MRWIGLLAAGLVCGGLMAQAPPSAFAPAPDKSLEEKSPPPPVQEELSAEKQLAAPADPIDAWMAKSSLRTQISQLMAVTIDSNRKMHPDDVNFLRTNTPGILFLRKVAKWELAKDFAAEARMLEKSTGIPLWVGVDPYDLAGTMPLGKNAVVTLPSLMTLAAADDAESTLKTGQIMAEILHGVGFDFYLGPPLYLAPTLDEARGTTRCLGGNPSFVAESGKILMEALKTGGVFCAPSGFPGGGLNRMDRGAAVLTTPKTILAENDLLPFAEAVQAGAAMVHVDATLAPTLDPSGGPACLSAAVMDDLLRKNMEFKGIILAGPVDAVEMGDKLDAAVSALTALQHGADMVLWQGSISQVQRAIERIAVAVERGEWAQAALQECIRRVLTAKDAWGKARATTEKPVKAKELAEWATRVERRAITLAFHQAGALPLLRENAVPVGITGTTGIDELEEALKPILKQVVQQPILTAGHIGDIQRFEIERLTSHMRGINTVVVVMTDKERIEGQLSLIRELKKNAPRVVVVYLGWPSHAAYFSEADAVLLAYSSSGGLNQTMTAVAEVLTGTGPIGFVDGLPDSLTLKAGEERSFSITDVVRTPSGRLPIELSEDLPAGYAARFNPMSAVKKTVWEFDGKKIDKPAAAWTFKEAGEHRVQVSVTDTRGETRSRSFTVVTTP